LDFGTPCGNFDSLDIFYASPFIEDIAKVNGKLLREIMSKHGFLPFNGEWWHFSYGDKEWAFANKKSAALYGQKMPYEIRYEKNPAISGKKIIDTVALPPSHYVLRRTGRVHNNYKY
jgi:hypothetical protein